MLRKINQSLKLKFIFASVAAQIMLVGLLLGNSIRLTGQGIEQNAKIRLAEIEPLLEAALSERLFERDYVSIRDILQKLMQREPAITYIVVLERDGTHFIDVGDVDLDALPKVDREIRSALDDGIIDMVSSISVGDEVVGTVHYGLSLITAFKARNLILLQGILIAVTGAALIILALFMLGRWLTKHLEALVRGTENIKKGEYSIKVDESQPDEIGELASNFNAMSEAVDKRTRELIRSQEKFQKLIEGVNAGVFVAQDGVIKFANRQVADMSGYSQKELIDMPILELIAPAHREKVVENYRKRISGDPDVPNNYRFQAQKQNRQNVWVEINSILAPWEEQPATLNVIRDVGQQVAMEEDLHTQKERAEVTLKSIEDGVVTASASGLTEFMNLAAERLTGWTLAEARGHDLKDILQLVDQQTGRNVMLDDDIQLRGHKKAAPDERLILRGRDDQEGLVEVSASRMHDREDHFIGTVFVLHDVSQEHKLREKLSYLATHDSLTGLVNRREFEQRLSQALFETRSDSVVHAMLYLDLDQFKVVNDTCGHLAGDALLKQLASELRGELRKTDTLSRLGGDEFGVLLKGCGIEPAVRTANMLRDTIKNFQFAWGDDFFALGVSVGIAEINSDSKSAQEIMSAADVACYAAKDKGRNRIHVYQISDTELTDRHREMHWVSQITQALKNDSFVLYQQPIWKIGDTVRHVTDVEVLLRMRRSDGQLNMPGEFIPAAERFDQMSKIDRYVIKKTFACLSKHRNLLTAGDFDGLALNLSGASVSDESLGRFINDQLEEHEIAARFVCFEVTETAAIANLAYARRLFEMLKRLGCRLSLDDFGRGLSSFNYLQNLPVDNLKIDRAFVSKIASNATDYAMVQAINDIGHTLGLRTIAEGVEDRRTLSCLRKIGVDCVQGYLFGRPTPLEQILTSGDCEVIQLKSIKPGM